MLAYHDASTSITDHRRNYISSYYNGNRYGRYQRQHELDELKSSKTRRYLKRTTKFLFSHLGLVGLVITYAIIGGFLFQLLEEYEDKVRCQEAYGEQVTQITKYKQKIVDYIQYNTTSSNIVPFIQKDNATVALMKIELMLYEYRDFIIKLSTRYRYYGYNCNIINKWTYPNSLLFAITVFTTIGYGHITPVTWEGQLCSICYASIGIPIFLLCVANLSGALGELFRLIYAKVICAPCVYIKKRRALRQRQNQLQQGKDVQHDTWTVDDENNKDSMKEPTNVATIATGEINGNGEQAHERVCVPLTITMIIIAAYILMGSALFHSFERWSMTHSGYFCFITLATIGFGDFVPGQQRSDLNANVKLVLGSIYVLFGMAILAMCFDLMQEEMVAKFRWIGTKVGIIDKTQEIDKRDSIISSPIDTARTTADHDNQTGSNVIRKASPRHHSSKIHPLQIDSSNETALHQRHIPTDGK